MQLFYRQIGEGKPFIILHGLYGASDNWIGFARKFKPGYSFFIPDLRNHGQSAHTADFNYSLMAYDVFEWMRNLQIEKSIIMGHSMGGKLAMELVKRYPSLFSALIVLDISPLSYNEHPRDGLLNHKLIIDSMQSIGLEFYKQRRDVESELLSHINNKDLCSFLLKNLYRSKDGQFRWKLNLQSLADNYKCLAENVLNYDYKSNIPALFIKAQLSDYINDIDKQAIRRFYPQAAFVEITKAEHWLHIKQTSPLMYELFNFFDNNIN